MVKVTSLHIEAESALGFSFGVRAQTEMKIRCVKGMHFLKVEYVDTRFFNGQTNNHQTTGIIRYPDMEGKL